MFEVDISMSHTNALFSDLFCSSDLIFPVVRVWTALGYGLAYDYYKIILQQRFAELLLARLVCSVFTELTTVPRGVRIIELSASNPAPGEISHVNGEDIQSCMQYGKQASRGFLQHRTGLLWSKSTRTETTDRQQKCRGAWNAPGTLQGASQLDIHPIYLCSNHVFMAQNIIQGATSQLLHSPCNIEVLRISYNVTSKRCLHYESEDFPQIR